jgi:hypothetical protein
LTDSGNERITTNLIELLTGDLSMLLIKWRQAYCRYLMVGLPPQNICSRHRTGFIEMKEQGPFKY